MLINVVEAIIVGRKQCRRKTLDDIRNLMNSMETEGLTALQFRKKLFHSLDTLEPKGDLVHFVENDLNRDY